MPYCPKCGKNQQLVIVGRETPHCSYCYRLFLFPLAMTKEEYDMMAEKECTRSKDDLVRRWNSSLAHAREEQVPGFFSFKATKEAYQRRMEEGERIIEMLSSMKYSSIIHLFVIRILDSEPCRFGFYFWDDEKKRDNGEFARKGILKVLETVSALGLVDWEEERALEESEKLKDITRGL